MATRDGPSVSLEHLTYQTNTPEQRSWLFRSAGLSPSSPSSLSSVPPSTLWVPLDEFTQTWADFGKEVTPSAPALTATGTAFLALSWEASALRQHTWAWEHRRQGRTRNAAYGYGRVIEGLSEASRQWNRVVKWLEQFANDQSCEPSDLEHVRPLIGQAVEQQRRLWALTQEVQQELLAVNGLPLSAAQQEGGLR